MKKITLILVSALTFLQANAQKLPAVQQEGIKAPANIKIDGKPTEWGGQFQAYNSTTELSYTIANDEKRLYIVAQTNNSDVLNRLVNGGLKLIIQKNGTQNDKDAPFVKFPFLEKGKRITVDFSNNRIISTPTSMRVVRAPEPSSKEEADKIADSLTKVNNKKIADDAKFIYTSGLAAIDTLLSVYNEKGIEAAAAVDNKKVYTIEMAINLEVLGLSVNKAPKFSYHLVVNGEPNKFSQPAPVIFSSTSADGTPASAEEVRAANERLQNRIAARNATTDFWAEYTLAK